MRATRRMYAVALGAAGLVLVGSMAGAVAYAANSGQSSDNGTSWAQGLSGRSGGMMGNWGQADAGDAPAVTRAQAKKLADAWVAENQPGATVDAGVQMPMGYLFTVAKGDTVVARIMVNDDTGAIYGGLARSGSGGMMGQGWGDGRGGMMGQGWANGRGQAAPNLSLADAQGKATSWLATNQQGSTIDTGILMPMGYAFTISKDATVTGRLMVFDPSGKVYFHSYSSTASGATA